MKSGGDTIFKRVTIRVILPEGHKPLKNVAKAGPGKGYAEDGIFQLLEIVAGNLETKYPHWEFRLVPVAPNAFNFVYAGLKADACVKEVAGQNEVAAQSA